MDKIEADYKEFLDKPEDFLAENWRDVLAVYVMKWQAGRRHKDGQVLQGMIWSRFFS